MSNVVTLSYPETSIALVTMQDRASHNTFSEALTEGLVATFREVENNSDIKVLLIQGYQNYFCCGGTQENLMEIHKGNAKCTDLAFYRFLLDFDLPTISAMQGHAIGGGLAFGCYADLIVMAEESLYSTNFMKYGFTPGLGSTYIIPQKLGQILGSEMLLTAKKYYGGELKERGVAAKVVRRAEVLETAIDLGRKLAEMPIISLKLLKQHLAVRIKEALPSVIEQELNMHEISFKQPEVKARIDALFSG